MSGTEINEKDIDTLYAKLSALIRALDKTPYDFRTSLYEARDDLHDTIRALAGVVMNKEAVTLDDLRNAIGSEAKTADALREELKNAGAALGIMADIIENLTPFLGLLPKTSG